MNGRKAKQFRKLAGVTKANRETRVYYGTNVKTKQQHHESALNQNGSPGLLATYKTATYVMNQCARKLNKMLKRASTTRQGVFA